MTTISALAFVPSAPLLVPEVAGGSAGLDEDLREASRAAVRRLTASAADGVVVVAGWSAGASWPQDATWSFDGFGVAARPAGEGGQLPWPLGIGAWLLDEAGWDGPRGYLTVGPDADTHAAIAFERAAVLVVGDGSARRTEKAPGHLDSRAESFDAAIAAALGHGDAAALGRIDLALADELMCAGAPTWRWLSSVVGTDPVRAAELSVETAPYGVGYFVAYWQLAD